jgi:hypothetical protein
LKDSTSSFKSVMEIKVNSFSVQEGR